VGFGEWDWAMLANEWDYKELDDWGLTLPNFDVEEKDYSDKNKEIDMDLIEDGLEHECPKCKFRF
ncbi:hypothetical protein EB118_11505, partial [bacterium]|nr:hypothetical protein [bacterium]